MALGHPDKDLSCVVHGADFTFCGERGVLDWIEGLMMRWFEVQVRARLGHEPGDDKYIGLLGRRIAWKEDAIEYQADPKHRQIVLDEVGLGEGAKSLMVTGKVEDSEAEGDELPAEEAMRFRALAVWLNFMAQDSPDLQFAVKEVRRQMSRPSRGSWSQLKRVARYIVGTTAAVYRYKWMYQEEGLKVFADIDWASCRLVGRWCEVCIA